MQDRKATVDSKQKKGLPKGCSTVSYIFAIIVGLVIVINVFGNTDSESKTDSSNVSTTVATTDVPIEISASKLMQAYIDNEVKADMQYDGKTVVINGYVDRIEQTDSLLSESEPVVYVGTGNSLENCLRCYLSVEQKELVAELEMGDKITVTGRCSGVGSSYFNLKCVNIYDAIITE